MIDARCRRIGPPPQFEPSWHTWQLNGCAWTSLICPSCPQCSNSPTMVVEVAVSRWWSWCSECQCRLLACVVQPHPQSERMALPATPCDWFTKAHRAAWDSCMAGETPLHSPNATGPNHDFSVRSLALAGIQRAHEPPDKQRFWLSTAQNIINSPHHLPNFQLLWNYRNQIREHLSSRSQERHSPTRGVPDPPFRDLLLHLSLRNWKSSFVIINGCFAPIC